MATLGELERAVMELLWDASAPMTGTEVRDGLVTTEAAGKRPAATTVLTVLSRLEAKHFVERTRSGRPHRYSALRSRAEHTAELMTEILGTASDRSAALARFVGQVEPADVDTLRELLAARSEL